MEEKITVHRPEKSDLALAVKDVLTLKAGPPFVLGFLILAIATNVIFAITATALMSYLDALWARMVIPKTEKPEGPTRVPL